MSRPDVDDLAYAAVTEGRQVRRDLRQAMLSGLALTVPLFVTLLVVSWMFDLVSAVLMPLGDALVSLGPTYVGSDILVKGIAAALVFGVIFAVGVVAQHGPDTRVWSRFDDLMADIPGIGSIYTSVNRMSDVLLESDTDSFQEVTLVEFPTDGSYAIAFLTADSPAVVEAAAGQDEMLTVYVPMAPNPVMGGHLLHLPRDRVHDVDLSVEEGMQAIMTTGMAIDETVQGESD